MPQKLKIEDILKPGEELTSRALSFQEVERLVAETEKKQKEILQLKIIDWSKLERTFITI